MTPRYTVEKDASGKALGYDVLQDDHFFCNCVTESDARRIADAMERVERLEEACRAALEKFEEYYASRTGAEPQAMQLLRAALQPTEAS